MRTLRALLIALFLLNPTVIVLLWSPSTAVAQMGKPDGIYYKSWAIVIATERYLLAPPLPGAIDDAKKVAQAFRRLGFDEVVELYDKDTSFRRLQQVLNDVLPRKVGRMDRLVIFYAGHAGTVQDSEGQDRGYLVPLDAQVNHSAKSITVDYLQEFVRRSASKHMLLLFDAPVFGWDTTESERRSHEARQAPELDFERRAVYVISAAGKGEMSNRTDGRSQFVQALLAGLDGAADLDRNGWLMASELGAYLVQQVGELSRGLQHPSSLRLDGDGDVVLVEGRKSALTPTVGQLTALERQQAAQAHYEHALGLLQKGTSAEEALERLDRAIASDPTYGNAYLLKSYIRLDVVPNLDEALVAGLQATRYAPDNPDSFYTLGLIYEKRKMFTEAEAAFRQALKVKADYPDVYFSLGTLYVDHLHDHPKSVEAFRRYLELGGTHARAREIVGQADRMIP